MDPGPYLDVIKFIGPPICKYWNYHRKLKEYSNILRNNKDDLITRKENIGLRLKSELHFGKIADKEVENWLKKAEKMIGEIGSLEDKVSQVGYLSRAFLGKRICEKIKETEKVYEEGKFSEALVIDDHSNRRMALPTPELVGETIVKEKIWEYLMGDSVCLIGVCGMGGIGKTTIMKHIHNKLLSEDKFDKVIWITVSQEFDVFKLQKQIASSLNEDLSKYEDTTERAAVLLKLLEETKRYVLILDDVWKRFSLHDVGIPVPTTRNGCKLVLTTRLIELALFMGCETVKVAPLAEEDALNLFLKHSGRDVYIPTLESTLKEILEQCAGLPLAITIIGSSMRGESDVRVWKNALNKLKKHAASVEGMAEAVLKRLKFSYDCLSDIKLKHCFLYCALYPEDFEIPKEELIEYWIVEGLIDEMETRQEMYDEGHTILKRLENNCLLEKAKNERCVKMHDIVRDLALHITKESPRYLVKAGMQMEELPNEQEWKEDLEKVSLMRNKIKEISSNVAFSKCKTLSTLFLQYNYYLERIDESFFTLMTELKILDLSDNYDIKALPNSVSELENLNALLLGNCWGLEYVPSLSKLKGLKMLDLGGTSIKEVPHGMEMLVRLTYLDLNDHWTQIELPAGILPKLSRLQHLSLDGTPALVIEEVAALRKLEFLKIQFNNLEDYHLYLSRLQRGFLNSYILRVGYVEVGGKVWLFSRYQPRSLSRLSSFTYEKVVQFEKLGINGHSILLPTDIQELHIFNCNDIKNLSDVAISATDLRYYKISSCNGLEVLFRGERDKAVSALPTPPGIFSHLKYFEILDCPKIKKLFWPDLMRNLQSLEEIRVSDCEQLVEIIGALEENKEEGRNSMVFALPQLRKMSLLSLPQLECICKGGSLMECNSLEEVEIDSCPKLKRIPLLLPVPPVTLRRIQLYSVIEGWVDSVEWDPPHMKSVLKPYLKDIEPAARRGRGVMKIS